MRTLTACLLSGSASVSVRPGAEVREVFAKRTVAISWTPEESEVEGTEHQDNANIHGQPFPEAASEEHEIYTDYDGCHRQHVKHDSYLCGNRHFWRACGHSNP